MCLCNFRTYTGCCPIGCVRRVFYLLFLTFTTKLILAASLGVDSSAKRPCWMDVFRLSGWKYFFDILKSGYAWSGQMFVSKSFNLNVKSIAINNVWNAKLNLFIYTCPLAAEMDVLRVATFYPHLRRTCRPTQMWVCGQDLSWNTTCNRNIMQIRNYCKCQSINVFADIHDVRHGLPT